MIRSSATGHGIRLPCLFLLAGLLWLGVSCESIWADDPTPERPPARSIWDPWKGSFRFIGGVIVVLVAIVVPMLLYDRFKYSPAAAQVRGELARLAVDAPYFAWQPLRQRIEQAVRKFYDVRSSVDLSPVSKLFTPELLEKQQAILKQCDKEGRQLVRRLTKLRRIEPVAVLEQNERSPSGIRVVVRLDRVQYQRDQYTLEIVAGAADTQANAEEVWTLIYNGRKWVVHDISDAAQTAHWPELPPRTAATVSSGEPPPVPFDGESAPGAGGSTLD